ncbi:phytoene synthase [Streptomyces griseocarneus]|nr:phytoene synthase [Streptomyces griseocarneus]
MSTQEIRAAGLDDDPRLARDYAACNTFLRRRNSAAYPAARLLLAPDKRPHWDAILAFCTQVDGLIDAPDRPVAARAAQYDAYVREFFALLTGENPWPHPPETTQEAVGRRLARAFAHSVATWNIPQDSVRLALKTIRTDMEVTEYPTFADLAAYLDGLCGQAAKWGNALLMSGGRSTEEADTKAAAASFGLQLTDCLRDLGEDLDDGRLYLPLEDLERFGLTRACVEEAARARQMTPALRDLVRFEVDRARRYFAEAADWWRLVDPAARELPRQYVRLGQFTLEQITRSGHDIFRTVPQARVRCAVSSCASFAMGYARAVSTRSAGRLAPRRPLRVPASRLRL